MTERTGWGEPCTSGPSSPGSGQRDVSAELPVWTNETVKRIALRGRHPPAPAASWDQRSVTATRSGGEEAAVPRSPSARRGLTGLPSWPAPAWPVGAVLLPPAR